MTECNGEQLEFHALGRRAVVGKFDGGMISSDGGGLLLAEVEARTGILARLARINHQLPRSGLRGGRGGAVRAGGRLYWVRGGLIAMGPQSMPAQRGSGVPLRSENGGCRTDRPVGVAQDAVGDGVMRRGARRAGAQAAVATGGGERRLSRIAPNSSG